MDNLLDSHTLIWFIGGDDKLSEPAKMAVELNAPNNYVSIVSIWEIAIKINVGKLKLKTSFEDFIKNINHNSFQILPVSTADALAVSSFPLHHRDPFDRMIIAQAQNYGLQIITKDTVFKYYDVSVLWLKKA